jgi:hypothetical protein
MYGMAASEPLGVRATLQWRRLSRLSQALSRLFRTIQIQDGRRNDEGPAEDRGMLFPAG